MTTTKKVKIELTEKERDYVSGMVEAHKEGLETFSKSRREGGIVDREIKLARRVGKKFTTT